MTASPFTGTESAAETDAESPFTAGAAETEQESADEPEAVPSLPLDVTFEILKNRRRRLVLEYLRDADGTTTIGELAEHIAAIENDTSVQQINSQQRKRVYIGLYQCHLPKMDDADVIDFNQDRGLVDLRPEADALYEYLDVEQEAPESAPIRSYGALTLASAVAFAVAHLASMQLVASVVVLGFLAGVIVVTVRADSAS